VETSEIIALIIVGALAGTAAASLMGLRGGTGRKGFTFWLRNTVIGIIGGLVGAFLLELVNVDLPEFLDASISLAELVVAFIGAIIVIFVVGLIQR
jgi:uncharacterized membrane protein YeaQ/YmgE (transglycosylase-associated protein family)